MTEAQNESIMDALRQLSTVVSSLDNRLEKIEGFRQVRFDGDAMQPQNEGVSPTNQDSHNYNKGSFSGDENLAMSGRGLSHHSFGNFGAFKSGGYAPPKSPRAAHRRNGGGAQNRKPQRRLSTVPPPVPPSGPSVKINDKNAASSLSPESAMMIAVDSPHESDDDKSKNPLSPNDPTDSKTKRRQRGTQGVLKREAAQRSIFDVDPVSTEHPLVNLADAIFVVVAIGYGLILSTYFSPARDQLIGKIYITATLVGIFQVFTVLWVIGQFFIRRLNGEWEVIDTPQDVRKHYLKSWFVLDVIVTIPFEFIFIGWANDVFFYVMFRHVLRWFRMFGVGQAQNPLLDSRLWLQLTFFVGFAIFSVHLAACLFWTLEGDDAGYGGAVDINYIDGLYWAIATLTSTGYGDHHATKYQSRLVACFFMLLGLFLVSSTTALVTSLLTKEDALFEEQNRKRKMLDSMFNHFSIPWSIQKEVIALFPSVLNSQSEVAFKDMIRSLPPFLADRVDDYLRAKMLKNVPLLDLEEQTVLMLSRKLQQRYVAAFDYVIEAGEIGREMYFLVHGIVEVLIPNTYTETVMREGLDGEMMEVEEEVEEEKSVATLRGGSYFGEIALIEDTKRTASIQAITSCEILVLQKEDLEMVVQRSAELQRRLAEEVNKRRIQLAKEKADQEKLEAQKAMTTTGTFRRKSNMEVEDA